MKNLKEIDTNQKNRYKSQIWRKSDNNDEGGGEFRIFQNTFKKANTF